MNDLIHARHAEATPPRTAAPGNEPQWGLEETAARADVSERLLRHCEARGLLAGARRANAAGRRYTQEDVHILRFVRQTHVLGFGMNEAAQLLSLWRGGQAPRQVLTRLAHALPGEHQPPCPILEALMEAGRRRPSRAGPLP